MAEEGSKSWAFLVPKNNTPLADFWEVSALTIRQSCLKNGRCDFGRIKAATMKKWVGGALTFLGFLGVAPIAWGVTAAFLQSMSPESAISPEARISLVILVVAGMILGGCSVLRIIRGR